MHTKQKKVPHKGRIFRRNTVYYDLSEQLIKFEIIILL